MGPIGGIPPLLFFLLAATPPAAPRQTPSQAVDFMNVLAAATHAPKQPLPKYFLNTPEILAVEGFFPETHKVLTDDGYILSLTRIGGKGMGGPPVLIMHGFIAGSNCWILRGREHDLPTMLADAGYDVWLGDLRGNTNSRYHRSISPNKKDFWNFSFHEHGIYDIPALVDKVLEKTGKDKLFYIGHSMGTTAFMVMTSMRPEYNEKIRASALLSPVAYMPNPKDMVGPLRITLYISRQIWDAAKQNGITELLPRSAWLMNFIRRFCGDASTQDLCLDLAGMFYGEHRTNIDREHVGYALSALVSGASTKTFYHLTQLFSSGYFTMFNYGRFENMKRYGSPKPPAYNLSQITAPVAVYFGYNDNLVSSEAALQTAKEMPNVVRLKPISDPRFTHFDFLYGTNAKEVLYEDVIELFNSM